MINYIVDTNIFLRFLLNDVPAQYEEATVIFTKAKRKEIMLFVPQIVIFEVQFALVKYYKFDKREVISQLESLLSAEYLEVESRDIFLTALTYCKNTNVSFVDCFLLSKSQIAHAKLFTFDKQMKVMANLIK